MPFQLSNFSICFLKNEHNRCEEQQRQQETEEGEKKRPVFIALNMLTKSFVLNDRWL